MEVDEQQVQECTETGETAPAAGEQEDFEVLIRGKYKDAFDARIQRILDGRLRKLREENERLQSDRACARETQKAYLAGLREREAAVREKYPSFCWQTELRDPQFGKLILAGVEPMQAYEAVHSRDLMEQAMRYAAQRTRRQMANSLAYGVRPAAENGGRSIAVTANDPRNLSSQELADIRRRVLEGEKIRF